MKTKLINIGIFLLLVIVSYTIVDYASNVYHHQVKQVVVEKDFNDSWSEMTIYHTPLTILNYRDGDGRISKADSIYQEKLLAKRNAEIKERDRIWDAPYKLITTYNHHEIVDFGDAKYIDSIKCIRYNQMVKDMVFYDNQDLLNIIAKEKEKQAIEDKENELENLNKKSCK